ncbi:hypothetical protein E2C01_015376 [Portunus trituberculatus]|uniref:Uncharacterized protein n=1 Tax=Portunus trituberculatus TaxID=210409 RepID=A0A5B7DLD6_PORTR|nr:hypothetical protein [Portunus trituberculatus]
MDPSSNLAVEGLSLPYSTRTFSLPQTLRVIRCGIHPSALPSQTSLRPAIKPLFSTLIPWPLRAGQ